MTMTARLANLSRHLDPRLALSIGLPLLVLLAIGQDCNWDLRNYHLYNPHAWWTGRYALDIAPAQLQTWHNPFLDLPLYALDRMGASGFTISLWLLVPAVVSLRLLLSISDRMALSPATPMHWAFVAAIAVSGATAVMEMGSSYNDWFVAASVLAAIRLLLDDPRGDRILPTLLAGLCLGGMSGLKLAMAPFCIAMAVASFVAMRSSGGGDVRWFRHLSLLAAGGMAGFVLTYGYWAVFLHQQFGNPFFPYFNQWFQSPSAPLSASNDGRFVPAGVWQALQIPFQLLRPSTLVSERLLADPRLLLGLLAGALLAWRSRGMGGQPRQHAQRLVVGFMVAATVLWAAMFGIYRYLLPVELLCSLAIVHALVSLQGSRAFPLLLGLVAAALMALTHVQDLERQPFAGTLSEIRTAPALGQGDVVVTVTGEPVAFAATTFPTDVPLVGLANNFMHPGRCTELQRRAEALVADHRGRVLLLDPHRGVGNEMLDRYGLAVAGDCSEFASRYGMLYLCPLDAAAMVRHCPEQGASGR
jgi:hypothetical protein